MARDRMTMTRRAFLGGSAALWTSAFGATAYAQPRRGGGRAKAAASAPGGHWQADTDRIVQSMMEEDDVPGVAIGIVRDGAVVYKKGYGHKRVPGGAAPDENTVFYIGSLSKALTAVGAMLLVQNGTLDLDAPASTYITDLPRKWRKITVKQFMSHTSGIPEIARKEKNAQASIDDVYRLMADDPLQSEPGTQEHYNNFNYAVTGHLIEIISKSKYIDYMTRQVFKPLGMDRTGIGAIGPENHAIGYLQGKKGSMTEAEPDVVPFGIPSGGLETNLVDLLKLEASLRTHTLLKPRFFKMMIAPVPGCNATPGWFTRTVGGVTVVSKNGASGGFSSFLAFSPERRDAIVMLRNVQGKGIGIEGPSNAILEACCGIPKHGAAGEGE